jgi:hypothetical protein
MEKESSGQRSSRLANLEHALEMRDLAEQGNSRAMIAWAKLLLSGVIVKRDAEQAAAWLELAIVSDEAEVIQEAVELYVSGDLARDGSGDFEQEAAKKLQLAAAQGDKRASILLCRHYYDLFPKSVSLEWSRVAANEGDSIGLYRYGCYFRHGWAGIKKDFLRAAYLYERAVDRGCEYAKPDLADMLRHGYGIPIDLERAATLEKEAGILPIQDGQQPSEDNVPDYATPFRLEHDASETNDLAASESDCGLWGDTPIEIECLKCGWVTPFDEDGSPIMDCLDQRGNFKCPQCGCRENTLKLWQNT